MFEKVTPAHPDKIADRIAGAIVDLAYTKQKDPRIAVEVLIGHGECDIIAETSVNLDVEDINDIVFRILGSVISVNKEELVIRYREYPQDTYLANNQKKKMRCGDNGIFKGVPVKCEERLLTNFVKELYKEYPFDGKCVLDYKENKLVICQSNAKKEWIEQMPLLKIFDTDVVINPLGNWFGGINVDSGATNRKLGSDMAGSVTGGGLHGKDLSKADVSVNIYCFLLAQSTGKEVEISCAIGDEKINDMPFGAVVEIARKYIESIGGFEKFAEWGLIR